MNAESSDPPAKSNELRKLETEYELATCELAARAPKTYAALIVAFLIFIVTALVLAANGKQLFPGWPLVWTFGVFGAGNHLLFVPLQKGIQTQGGDS